MHKGIPSQQGCHVSMTLFSCWFLYYCAWLKVFAVCLWNLIKYPLVSVIVRLVNGNVCMFFVIKCNCFWVALSKFRATSQVTSSFQMYLSFVNIPQWIRTALIEVMTFHQFAMPLLYNQNHCRWKVYQNDMKVHLSGPIPHSPVQYRR